MFKVPASKDMFKSGKTYSNSWWPDDAKDADPNNPFYKNLNVQFEILLITFLLLRP